MFVHSACPHCRNECVWSDTSETKYIRCSHCEKTFVISTWGVGQTVTHVCHRPRKDGPLIRPWLLLLALTVSVLGGAYFIQSLERPADPEPKVTLDNFQRLNVGMKELEVRHILGFATRRDESMVPKLSNSNLRYRYEEEMKKHSQFPNRCFWEEGENVIWITFVEGKVKQFGATLDGEQYGEPVKAPLILEMQQKDEG